MENETYSPMALVYDVITDLRGTASLCGIMMNVGDTGSNIDPDDVAQVMTILWVRLMNHIKTLDAIQWPERKAASA